MAAAKAGSTGATGVAAGSEAAAVAALGATAGRLEIAGVEGGGGRDVGGGGGGGGGGTGAGTVAAGKSIKFKTRQITPNHPGYLRKAGERRERQGIMAATLRVIAQLARGLRNAEAAPSSPKHRFIDSGKAILLQDG